MSLELNVVVYDTETAAAWHEVQETVAEELDVEVDDLESEEVLREVLEAYRGGEPLGRWRES